MKQKVPFLVFKKALRRAGFFYALRIESFGSDFFDFSPTQELAQTAKTELQNKNDQNPKRERACASILRIRGELPAGPQDPFSSEKSISTGVGKPSMGR